MTDDHTMIKDVIAQVPGAFDILMNRYKRKAFDIAYSYTRNWSDADDIVQDVFIKVYNALQQFQFQARFSTWFYRIVMNQCQDFGRQKGRNQRVFIDTPDGAPDVATQHSPRSHMIEKEEQNDVAHAIEKLPEKQKELIYLKYRHGFRISDIADMLHINEGTVKSQLFDAIKKLKASVRRQGQTHGFKQRPL